MNLKYIEETVVAEISIARKKLFFVVIYRSPSQTTDELQQFINRLQSLIDTLSREKPYALILTGDFNCLSSQWWAGDTDSPGGILLEEVLDTNNLYQLIDEPTNIRDNSLSCIDLIITDQPNLFIESGVHSSLDEHCQHQIVYGKVNVSLPSPPPFKRTLWDYSKANVAAIQRSLSVIDWSGEFNGLDIDQMVGFLTDAVLHICTQHIPNKIVTFNNKDPPWMNPVVKTAIKRSHRVYRKFIKRGCLLNEWSVVKSIRNKTRKMVATAKESYFKSLGSKLSDPKHGIKTYWSILNRLVNKKKTSNVPPLLVNNTIVSDIHSKTNIFNDYFAQQCTVLSTSNVIPIHMPRPNNVLQGIDIDETKILKLIRKLNI